MEFKDELIGERIALKRNIPNKKLAETIFKTIDSNREYLGKWLPWEKEVQKIEDEMVYLLDNEEKFKEGKKAVYGIYLKGKFIGSIDLHNFDEKSKSAEIGYWISEKFARKGYTTEAVKILERYFFNELSMNRIQIKCDSENEASLGVIQKCGYKFEGLIREAAFSEHFGNFRSKKIFSKLKSEY